MANYQVMLKEAQDKFNLVKWNRIQKKEELDALDTESAMLRGEFRLLQKLVKEEEEKAKAKKEAEAQKKDSLDKDIEGTP